MPWHRPFPGALFQVIHRIFPLARGIFEDKVANFWCASNVLIKWRRWVSTAGMARVSCPTSWSNAYFQLATIATLGALIPTILVLLYSSLSLRPNLPPNFNGNHVVKGSPASSRSPPATIHLLPTALFTSSLSFFLFSFQVHEKSILLPLMPLTLMMTTRSGKGEDEVWDVGVLVNNVAVFR